MAFWAHSNLIALLIQTGVGVGLLWLFLPKNHQIPLWRILVTGLMLPVINLGVESGLQDYLQEGTIPLQGVFFVLVMYGLGGVPFPRAVATIFCLFNLMLGWGLLEENMPAGGMTEEEHLLRKGLEESPHRSEDIVANLLEHLLDQRMLALRALGRDVLYDMTPDAGIPVEPTPAPAMPTSTPVPGSDTMTGEDFLNLFNPAPTPVPQATSRSPDSSSTPIPEPAPTEDWSEPSTGKVTGEHLSEIVKVRNRSTDQRFNPPDYDIGAVGIGERGKYAIVNGEFLAEGSILRTGMERPRGWRLMRITSSVLYWQPLR